MKYKSILITNERKRDCTCCDIKLVDGRQVVAYVDDRGKRKAYFCSENCVKKYDERFYGEDRNIKIGLVAYGRVCQDAYDTNSKENDISLCYEGNMRLVKSENCENGDERVSGDNVDTYNLICEEVFVVSVKDL